MQNSIAMPTRSERNTQLKIDAVHARRSVWLAFLCFSGLAVLAYSDGLRGPFVFDDYNNIVANKALFGISDAGDGVLQALLSGNAGPLKRPLSMLSFALNHAATGLDAFYFKLTNLAIHLVNALLVFLVCRRLLEAGNLIGAKTAWIALGASVVWMLHPMQLTSVLYVVQRMTSLCATFMLIGTLAYLAARQRMLAGERYSVHLWLFVPVLGGLATLTKENGALLFPLLLVIEWTLLSFRVRAQHQRARLQAFFAIFVALPLAALAIFVALHPEWVTKSVLARPFTVSERLMTEARVLVLYLDLLFVPAISKMALFYDDFPISRSFFEPMTTLVAVVFIAACVISALIWRRRFPWWAFAVLWYLVSHAMESTFIMLELVHPHRNYLAYLGPILGCAIGVERYIRNVRREVSIALGCAVVIMLAGTTYLRAHQWQDPALLAAYEVRHRPESARAHYEYGRLAYIANEKTPDSVHYRLAYRHLMRASELNPAGFAAPIALVLLTTDKEHLPEPSILHELTNRLALHMLPPSELIHLRTMINCRGEERCAQRPETVMSIFGSALRNERQTPRIRADLVTLLGMYYSNTLGDLRACVKLLREAAALLPDDPQRHVNLAHALIMSKDFIAAKSALDEAEHNDPLGRLQFRIKKYRQDIDNLVGRGSGNSTVARQHGLVWLAQ